MKHLAIKVTNKYESEAVQKALFDMGFSWSVSGKTFFDTNCKYLKPFSYLVRDLEGKLIEHSNNLYDNDIPISSSDFFSTYAGHIERFPDYVCHATLLDDPELNKSEDNKVQIEFERGFKVVIAPSDLPNFKSMKEKTQIKKNYIVDYAEPASNISKLKASIKETLAPFGGVLLSIDGWHIFPDYVKKAAKVNPISGCQNIYNR